MVKFQLSLIILIHWKMTIQLWNWSTFAKRRTWTVQKFRSTSAWRRTPEEEECKTLWGNNTSIQATITLMERKINQFNKCLTILSRKPWRKLSSALTYSFNINFKGKKRQVTRVIIQLKNMSWDNMTDCLLMDKKFMLQS